MLVQIGHAGAINMRGIDKVLVTVETEDTYPNPTLFSKGPKVVKQDNVLVINYTDADGKKVEQRLNCGSNSKMANDLKDIVLKQTKELENVGATQALEEALKSV